MTTAITFVLLAFAQRVQLDREFEQRAVSIAQATAADPEIRSAMASVDTGSVQGVAERIRVASGASYVVVIDLNRFRHSHPIPALIGQQVTEPIVVTDGKPHVGINVGSTGRSANGKVPLYGPNGQLVGEVSVGIPVERVTAELWRQLPVLGLIAGTTLAVGSAASLLLARRLKRTTFGLELHEIAALFQEREAMLYCIREGVICFDPQGRITVLNDEARHLLGLPSSAEGRLVTEVSLDRAAAEMLATGREVTDEVLPVGDRLLVVNNRPTDRDGGPPGSVATLRDSTELHLLSHRAEAARKRLKLLYDASVHVGTTLDVTRTSEELATVAIPRFADFVSVDLLEPVLHGEEPLPGLAIPMRRTAVRGIRDGHPLYPVGTVIPLLSSTPQAEIVGSREVAILAADLRDAPGWQAQDPEGARRVIDYGIHSLIAVPLRARGSLSGVVNFWRSEKPEPFDQDDLSLAEELAARAAVCIDNARRYTREHSRAVLLQRSLLPRGLPDQNAVDTAYRYLPAQAGVGGDWFDVIPLPGSRVALVVGDVVGHGLHAAATMGRLRTAVHNFSTLDLPPDELLGRLDELVNRIDQDEAAMDASEVAITGATCLYAIYDPVSRRCTMARAGHLPPVLVRPDGAVEFVELPPGPPLGLVGLPFETAQIQLPEGSRLVLYTDGLVEDRDRDIDIGLDLLRDSLTGPARTPEETCEAILDALLPEHPADDIALLVARTRVLPADHVAEWEVQSDPAAVAGMRAAVTRQLEDWGLSEMEFATELILSELVTNAIRYAGGPIGVRVLRDRSLICEVSDAGSTSPHLRYAADTDEGGRGLFLVAQLAEHWGTRYTATGKVIWAEQPMPPPSEVGPGD